MAEKARILHIVNNEKKFEVVRWFLENLAAVEHAENIGGALQKIEKTDYRMFILNGAIGNGEDTWKKAYDNIKEKKKDAEFLVYGADDDILKKAEEQGIKSLREGRITDLQIYVKSKLL